MATSSQWSTRYIADPINDRLRYHEAFIGSEENWVFTTDRGERPDEAELIVRSWDDGRPLQICLASRGVTNYTSLSNDNESVVRFDQEKPRDVKWGFAENNELPQGGYACYPKFPGGDRGFIWQMLQHETVVVRFQQPRGRHGVGGGGTHTLTFHLEGLAEALDTIPGVAQPSAPPPISVGTGIKIGVGVVAVLFVISCSAVCL